MKKKEIKKLMLEFSDVYGNQLFRCNDIEGARTREDLNRIIKDHQLYLSSLFCTSVIDLENLRSKTGLNNAKNTRY